MVPTPLPIYIPQHQCKSGLLFIHVLEMVNFSINHVVVDKSISQSTKIQVISIGIENMVKLMTLYDFKNNLVLVNDNNIHSNCNKYSLDFII